MRRQCMAIPLGGATRGMPRHCLRDMIFPHPIINDQAAGHGFLGVHTVPSVLPMASLVPVCPTLICRTSRNTTGATRPDMEVRTACTTCCRAVFGRALLRQLAP